MTKLLRQSGITRHQQDYQSILDRVFNLKSVETYKEEEEEEEVVSSVGAAAPSDPAPAAAPALAAAAVVSGGGGGGSDTSGHESGGGQGVSPVVRGSVDTTASSNFDAVAPAGGKVVVDDEDAPGFYNKPRIISYPNLDDTIDKALTPDSYIHF